MDGRRKIDLALEVLSASRPRARCEILGNRRALLRNIVCYASARRLHAKVMSRLALALLHDERIFELVGLPIGIRES